jgi:hypothetical protein
MLSIQNILSALSACMKYVFCKALKWFCAELPH